MNQNHQNGFAERPFTILVMDDEDYIRSLLKKILEKFNYTVELAVDGDDAINQYKSLLDNRKPVDLVILDLTIPEGMGGEEAAQRILAMDPGATIAVSSGNSNDPLMIDYKSYGLAGSLPKPYRLNKIQSAIDAMIKS